jgi:hypothetical protein
MLRNALQRRQPKRPLLAGAFGISNNTGTRERFSTRLNQVDPLHLPENTARQAVSRHRFAINWLSGRSRDRCGR